MGPCCYTNLKKIRLRIFYKKKVKNKLLDVTKCWTVFINILIVYLSNYAYKYLENNYEYQNIYIYIYILINY